MCKGVRVLWTDTKKEEAETQLPIHLKKIPKLTFVTKKIKNCATNTFSRAAPPQMQYSCEQQMLGSNQIWPLAYCNSL